MTDFYLNYFCLVRILPMNPVFQPVLDNIYLLSTSGDGNFPDSFCFYIDDERKTLVDTPLDIRFPEILQNHKVESVLNSHFHRDHCGCNHLFPNASFYAHSLDIPPMLDSRAFLDNYGMIKYANAEQQQHFLDWLHFVPSPEPQTIEDGQLISTGRYSLKVIHTPGHSPGHCVFYIEELDVLLSADIDLTAFGPWYGNTSSNLSDFIASIRKVKAMKPGAILSCHKGLVDKDIDERLDRYLGRIFAVSEQIIDLLQEPRKLDDIVEQRFVYGKWPHPTFVYRFFEMVSMLVQLERLSGLGLVDYQDGLYVYTSADKSLIYK